MDILLASVSLSSDKCTSCESLWLKASAKGPQCKCKYISPEDRTQNVKDLIHESIHVHLLEVFHLRPSWPRERCSPSAETLDAANICNEALSPSAHTWATPSTHRQPSAWSFPEGNLRNILHEMHVLDSSLSGAGLWGRAVEQSGMHAHKQTN